MRLMATALDMHQSSPRYTTSRNTSEGFDGYAEEPSSAQRRFVIVELA
jgi:hypothetical protein